ncbi:hypothetical protein [Oerskovia flava]|uniref:hypothetical protein n=1 Tax=Oerskovia flava TaxID=2986422 RepID=UPI002240B61B|nr:hypothetical protein [Oerskovia sp. JB1-3-2]
MGTFEKIRHALTAKLGRPEAQSATATPPASRVERVTPARLARELIVEFPDAVPADVLTI